MSTQCTPLNVQYVIFRMQGDKILREQLFREITETFANAFSQDKMIDSCMRYYNGTKGISGP